MKKRLILVGKAASGKDHARKIYEALGLKYAVSYTTRPPREGEVDGKDYFFIDSNEFNSMINRDLMYEYVVFNDWYYGTSQKQMFDDIVFIMTPKGLAHLDPSDREESYVVYFDIPEDVRRKRIEERVGNADSIDRRIEADEIDFADFTNYDHVILTPDFTKDLLIDLVKKNIELNLDNSEEIYPNRRTISRRDYINNKLNKIQ